MAIRDFSLYLLLPLVLVGSTFGQKKPEERDLDQRVHAALEKCRPVLLKKLSKAHGGELALLCLAAVHEGVPLSNVRFKRAMVRLTRLKLSGTYELSLRLMVMADHAKYPGRRAAAASATRRLLQNASRGGFSYHPKSRSWDLSNTQYAALGLRAATSLGVKIHEKVWLGLVKAAVSAQSEEGGFSYSQGGRRPYSSMTVAGIAILQVCSQHLDLEILAKYEVPRRIADAWRWMAEHKDDIGDRKVQNSFYFHYGMERACILSAVTEVDGKDWYRAGAEMLLRTQLRRGGWHSGVDIKQGGKDSDGSDSVSTAFAVLFLRRKFKKLLSPITPGGGMQVDQLSEHSTASQIGSAVENAVRQGLKSMPRLLKAVRSKVTNRRKAAVKSIYRITGKDFGLNPHRSPEGNRAAIKAAELWWLKSARKQG